MNKRIAYANYFSAYLVNELENLDNVKNIILFGSVARGDYGGESDVDIFVEVKKKNKKFESSIEKLVGKFYRSREGLFFRNRGVDNKINVIAGKLEEWSDLKKSIESTGLVLYGPYVASGVKGKKWVIIYWDKIGKNRGAFLNKLYGFSSKNKKYKGLVEGLGGRKIGKSSIMIPVESQREIFELVKKYRVRARVKGVYV